MMTQICFGQEYYKVLIHQLAGVGANDIPVAITRKTEAVSKYLTWYGMHAGRARDVDTPYLLYSRVLCSANEGFLCHAYLLSR